ncbi:ChbG/HpnK family deacetylase [Dongshaea marina]|uniref:ChbG/HpnK family deacetylase n=1 Tax=Dongshaea marina TaxID=2047966 RepID=UPI000D3E37CD|nr:ChbG/HpnK family deacetylase [Dongshaea marina]
MQLILNADDFGLTPGVNRGILRAMHEGVVHSTTLMVNQPATGEAIRHIRQGEVPDVGLHLTLTAGRPLLSPEKIPDLVDTHGYFLSREELFSRESMDLNQVYAELRAQYDYTRFYKLELTHLDCHHFAAIFPRLREAFIELANEVQLPVRRIDQFVGGQEELKVPTPDGFDASFYAQGVSLDQLQQSILNFKGHSPRGPWR